MERNRQRANLKKENVIKHDERKLQKIEERNWKKEAKLEEKRDKF